MRDISPPKDLKPQKRFFKERGEEMVNGDGIIRLMQTIDTPEAKAVYHAFRLRYAELKEKFPDEPDEKRRNVAIVQAIKDRGWNVNAFPLSE